MATRDEIYTAIRNADAAGDSAGVRKLGDYLKTMDAAPAAAAPRAPFDRAKFMDQEAADDLARRQENTRDFAGDTLKAGADTVLSMAPQIVLTPAAGIAGAIASPFVGTDKAAEIVRTVQGWGYAPKSDAGKQTAEVMGNVMAKSEIPGQFVAEKTGSPALGAAVTTGIQGAAAFLDPAVRGAFRSVGGAAAGAAREAVRPVAAPGPRVEPTIGPGAADPPNVTAAKDYVANTLKLDWDSVSAAAKAQLSEIAKSAGSLENMDPAAIARQIKFESLPVPVPATRGTLARDPVAMRREGNAAATTAGRPIAEIQEAGNAALLQNLDVLKGKVSGTGKTAATATGPEQAGGAVQGAARGKAAASKSSYDALYKTARETEPDARASIAPITDLLISNPEIQHVGFVQSWLNRAAKLTPDAEGKPVQMSDATLRELDDLRKTAVGIAKTGGDNSYYAGEVVKAIDASMDDVPAGATAWKAARDAFKAHKMEFSEQGAVGDLVNNASRTDRATALEGTTRAITTGSLEDIRKVKSSLLTGGDDATRTAGKQAWREVRRQVIDGIKNDATKGVATLPDGSANLQPGALKSAIDKLGPDKLNEIFGPGTAKQLYKILDVARDAKTLPTSGGPSIGSSTLQNILSFLEKGTAKFVDQIPFVGKAAGGALRAGIEITQDARAAKASATTPLHEALGKAARRGKIGDPGALRSTVPLSQIGAQRR